MNFCFVVNDAYVNKLLVLMTSIFINNSEKELNFYILTSSMNKKNRECLDAFFYEYNTKIVIIDIDDKCLEDFPLLRKDFDRTPYYKLLIPIYIPQDVSRVLYLDADIIVNKSLDELYNMDLRGKVFAAVPDPFINGKRSEYLDGLGILNDNGDYYFNSGMILFDMEVLREEYSFDIIKEYVKNHGSNFKFHDQEVLNGLYYKKYYIVEENYNYIANYRGAKDFLKYCFWGDKNQIDNVVIHYASEIKPWSKGYFGKYREVFWRYAEKSIVYEDMKKNRKVNYYCIAICFLKKCLNKLVRRYKNM